MARRKGRVRVGLSHWRELASRMGPERSEWVCHKGGDGADKSQRSGRIGQGTSHGCGLEGQVAKGRCGRGWLVAAVRPEEVRYVARGGCGLARVVAGMRRETACHSYSFRVMLTTSNFPWPWDRSDPIPILLAY